MSQGNTVLPTVGVVSGLTMTQDANAALQAILTQNSGASAPTNGPSAAPILGQMWIDTSVTPNILKMFDGTSWLPFGYIDVTNHLWLPFIGGGSDTIASGATTDLGSKGSTYLTISGVTSITSFGSTAPKGTMKVLRATGVFTLTHNATSLILPNNGNNITTAVGDLFLAVHLGSGNWAVTNYQRADGTALNTSAVFTGAVSLNGGINVAVSTDQNDWAPAGLATANRIFVASTANITITGISGPATNGQSLVIHNTTGIGSQTFLPQSTLSSSSNRFIMPAPIVLTPGNSVVFDYDSTGGGWRSQTPVRPISIAGGYRSLVIQPSTVSVNTMVKITADALTVESTLGEAVRLQNVNVTVASTVNGANGLDTSSLSPSGLTVRTWLYEYVIWGTTVNTVAGLLSLSSANPTMPAGYTFKARVGSVGQELSTATNRLLRQIQYGDVSSFIVDAVTLTQIPQIVAGNAGVNGSSVPTWTTPEWKNCAPPTAAALNIHYGNGYNLASVSNFVLAPSTLYGGAGSVINPQIAHDAASMVCGKGWLTPLSSVVAYAAGGSNGAFVGVADYRDNLC